MPDIQLVLNRIANPGVDRDKTSNVEIGEWGTCREADKLGDKLGERAKVTERARHRQKDA